MPAVVKGPVDNTQNDFRALKPSTPLPQVPFGAFQCFIYEVLKAVMSREQGDHDALKWMLSQTGVIVVCQNEHTTWIALHFVQRACIVSARTRRQGCWRRLERPICKRPRAIFAVQRPPRHQFEHGDASHWTCFKRDSGGAASLAHALVALFCRRCMIRQSLRALEPIRVWNSA